MLFIPSVLLLCSIVVFLYLLSGWRDSHRRAQRIRALQTDERISADVGLVRTYTAAFGVLNMALPRVSNVLNRIFGSGPVPVEYVHFVLRPRMAVRHPIGWFMTSWGRTTFFASTPDMIKEVVTTRRKLFPKPARVYSIVRIYGENVVSAVDESSRGTWKKHRSITYPAFNDANMRLVARATSDTVDAMVSSWVPASSSTASKCSTQTQRSPLDGADRSDGSEGGEHCFDVRVVEDMTSLALEVVSIAAYNKALHMFSPELREHFAKSFINVLRNFRWALILPAVLHIPFGRFPQLKKDKRLMEQYLRDLIRDTRAQAMENEEAFATRQDLLSLLIRAAIEMDRTEGVSDEELLSNIFVFYLAGHETTAASLAFALAHVAQRPEVQHKCYIEVEQAMSKNKQLTYEDVPKLKYCTAVFKEAVRLHPPALHVPKEAQEDVLLGTPENGQVLIEKGTYVYVDIMQSCLNPNYWNDPHEYIPERLVRGDPREDPGASNPYAYTPFSAGRRMCLGQGFAKVEATIAIAKLLHRFRVELSPGQDGSKALESVFDGSLLSHPRSDLCLRFIPRNHTHEQ